MVNGVQFMRPPEVYSIDIGTRAAAILVPTAWAPPGAATEYHPQGKHLVGESAMRLGVNLVPTCWAAPSTAGSSPRSFPLYDGRTRAGRRLPLRRGAVQGSWDVNPALQNSVLQGLKDNTGIDVDYAPHAVPLDDPELGQFPAAVHDRPLRLPAHAGGSGRPGALSASAAACWWRPRRRG